MKLFKAPATIVLLVLLAATIVACEIPPPAGGEATQEPAQGAAPTAASTPTPELQPTGIPTPLATESPTPTEAPTQSPTAVPTPAPMAVPAPTATPDVATATPAPAGRALQGVQLPWVRQFPNHFQLLEEVASQHPEITDVFLELTWMLEQLSYDNADGFYLLAEIVLQFPPGDSSLAQTIAGLEWVADGIDSDELRFLIDLQSFMEQGWDLARVQAALANTSPGAWRATPTPAPKPTLGPQLALSDLPWARSAMNDVEQNALASLQKMERAHGGVAGTVLRFGWVADNITEDEQVALFYLAEIAMKFSRIGSSVGEIHEVLGNTEWLVDGITRVEGLFLRDLTTIPERDTLVANLLARPYSNSLDDYTPAEATQAPTPTPAPSSASEFSWAQDGLTAIEREALGYLQDIQGDALVFDSLVMNHKWLVDGIINEEERRFLCIVSTTPEPGTRLAIVLSQSPSESLPACPSSAEGSPTPTPAPTEAPSSGASVSISPEAASPGDSVTISGSGFPAFTAISAIEVFGVPLIAPSSIQTGSDGSFSVSVVVPELPPGQHLIKTTIDDRTVIAAFIAFSG